MEEKELTIKLETIPEDEVRFRIVKEGESAVGAKVTLCTKGVIPLTFTKTADGEGKVSWNSSELVPAIGEAIFNQIPWLFVAYLDGSNYGVWEDDAKFELKTSYEYTLKKHEKVPTFFIKIYLRDVIGVEMFSNFIAKVEEKALETAGLEVVKVLGQGTRTVEVQFKPPWHDSPLVISWTAVWFILKVAAVAGAIIAVLVVLRWTFGRTGAAVVGGAGALIALILLLMATAPKAKKAIEKKVRGRER